MSPARGRQRSQCLGTSGLIAIESRWWTTEFRRSVLAALMLLGLSAALSVALVGADLTPAAKPTPEPPKVATRLRGHPDVLFMLTNVLVQEELGFSQQQKDEIRKLAKGYFDETRAGFRQTHELNQALRSDVRQSKADSSPANPAAPGKKGESVGKRPDGLGKKPQGGDKKPQAAAPARGPAPPPKMSDAARDTLQRLAKVHEGLNEVSLRYQQRATAVITPAQLRRLQEVKVQARGVQIFLDRTIREKLKITPEQFDSVLKCVQDCERSCAEWAARARQGKIQSAEAVKKVRELRRRARDQAFAVLEPDQRSVLERMLGPKPPFEPDELRFRVTGKE